MFEPPKDFVFDEISDSVQQYQYTVHTSDILEFSLYANDGFKLIDLAAISATQTQYGGTSSKYEVRKDGTVKLPVIGDVYVVGKTVDNLVRDLEGIYEKYYNKPYVKLKVANMRVAVFSGNSETAMIVKLENEQVRLIDLLATSGGIEQDGKAKNIRIIREMHNGENKVFQIDLSTIEGIRYADFAIRANDVIYIRPRKNTFGKLVKEIAPIVGVLANSLALYGLIRTFQ